MSRRPNRSQVVFLVGAVLAAWVLLKLGLLLARSPVPRGTLKIATPRLHIEEAGVQDALVVPAVEAYLAGGRDPFHEATLDTALFVRATIRHELGREVAISRCALDCRMVPKPLRELRLRLPDGARLLKVATDQLDRQRPVDQQGRVLVVPIQPEPLHRAHHRCRIALTLESPVSSRWRAPAIACAGAVPARCETGDLGVLVPPGARIEVVPAATPRGLTALSGDAVPAPLATPHTLFAYHYRDAGYDLAFRVRRLPEPDDGKKGGKDGGKVVKGGKGEVDDGGKGGKGGKGGTIDEPDFVVVGPETDFPLKLTMVVQTDGSDPQIQAVLRDRESGLLYRGLPGDLLPNGLKVHRISDNAVILMDPTGRRFIFQGRFATP